MGRIFKNLGILSMIFVFAFSCTGCSSRTIKTAGSYAVSRAKNLISSQNTRRFATEVAGDVATDAVIDQFSSNNSSGRNNQVPSSGDNSPTRRGTAAATGAAVAATAASAVAAEMMDNSAPKGDHWIKDNSTGVYLWNPEPQEGETIQWNGTYVQDGAYKYAEGAGSVIWMKNGRVIQTDRGSFSHGKHNGEFQHVFPSGNVEYSNWNHGEEIPMNHQNNSPTGVHYVGTYRSSGLKAYMLLETLNQSSDGKSFDVRVKATGMETVYLDYHIWDAGNAIKFFNSQGFSGVVNPSATPIEYEMWRFVRETFGRR